MNNVKHRKEITMKKLNTTLEVNGLTIEILHGDGIFISDREMFPDGVANLNDDIPAEDAAFFDLTDGCRYYTAYPDKDVVEAIDEVLYNQILVCVKSWDNEGNFEGMDGKHYQYDADPFNPFLVETSGAERVLDIKEAYCDGRTNEVVAFLVLEAK